METAAEVNDENKSSNEAVADDTSMRYTAIGSSSSDENVFSVEEAVEQIGFGKFQWKLSLLTGIAWMADAMELMILSIISPELRCQWQLYTWQEALITTVVFVGMMFSSSLWGNICDKYGRRAGLIVCVVWTFYMGFISSFSPTFFWILFLRGMVGVGVGGVPQSVTLYSEFLPQKSRATCIMLIEVFWAVGTCFEVLLALFIMPTLGWRYLLAFSSLPLLVFSLLCWWLPESARYNVQSGHSDKAYTTLKHIALENNRPMPMGKLYAAPVQQERGRISNLFKTKEMRLTTILLWLIWFNCAFAYYGIVLMTTELLQQEQQGEGECFAVGNKTDCNLSCHELTTADYVDLLWTTLAEFPGLLLTVIIINVVGRKATMAITFVGFSVFTLLLTMCTSRSLMIAFLFVARASISGGFQAAYVYTPEVYPTNVRAIGLGTCSGFARLGAIITPFIAQVLLRTSQPMAVVIYAAVSLLAGIMACFLPIETKGREMKEAVEMTNNLN